MSLRSVEIENYRAIRRGKVTFGRTTVLFGENDSGRSSIFEALGLILGSPQETFETKLKPLHFHRGPDGEPGRLLIRLRISEDAPSTWKIPEHLARRFPASPGRSRDLEFEFRAQLEAPSERITHTWRIGEPGDSRSGFDCDIEVLEWLRDASPVLWLRPGQLTGFGNTNGDGRGGRKKDPELEELEVRHRNLLTGQVPDLPAEIERGAQVAQAVMESHRNVLSGAGPLFSAMASDILDRGQLSHAAGRLEGTGPHKIAMLLLLGAILQVLRRNASEQTRPVLVIENPESNLHPMTLAAVWRITERIVWQKIVGTNSGTILANAPLESIRRITRCQGVVTEWSVHPHRLSKEDIRRVSYHLRSRRASAMFARCWLLVEGETEHWVMPELARVCGFDLGVEGVACVEFAQCGLTPLTKLAGHLGIAWHVLADGDEAGGHYQEAALKAMGDGSDPFRKVTRLREQDIEHCFWQHGFAEVIRRVAYPAGESGKRPASPVIRKAIEKTSKPFLALSLIEAAGERGPGSIPPVLREVIESCIGSARATPRQPKLR